MGTLLQFPTKKSSPGQRGEVRLTPTIKENTRIDTGDDKASFQSFESWWGVMVSRMEEIARGDA